MRVLLEPDMLKIARTFSKVGIGEIEKLSQKTRYLFPAALNFVNSYRIRRNFRMAKFSKMTGLQAFRKNIFEN